MKKSQSWQMLNDFKKCMFAWKYGTYLRKLQTFVHGNGYQKSCGLIFLHSKDIVKHLRDSAGHLRQWTEASDSFLKSMCLCIPMELGSAKCRFFIYVFHLRWKSTGVNMIHDKLICSLIYQSHLTKFAFPDMLIAKLTQLDSEIFRYKLYAHYVTKLSLTCHIKIRNMDRIYFCRTCFSLSWKMLLGKGFLNVAFFLQVHL